MTLEEAATLALTLALPAAEAVTLAERVADALALALVEADAVGVGVLPETTHTAALPAGLVPDATANFPKAKKDGAAASATMILLTLSPATPMPPMTGAMLLVPSPHQAMLGELSISVVGYVMLERPAKEPPTRNLNVAPIRAPVLKEAGYDGLEYMNG